MRLDRAGELPLSADGQAFGRGTESTDRIWHSLPAKGLVSGDTIWLREPADADVGALLRQVRAGNYGQPFALDSVRSRRLHFSLRFVQSEMLLDHPARLTLSYTRQMMAFLLFQPHPRDLLLVGLGGGSLTKFCHRHLRETRITTVEINPRVIEFGELFELPAPDERYQLVQADAADYLSELNEQVDVVVMDGCDEQGVAPQFCTADFFQGLRRRLRPSGMVVLNLIGLVGRSNILLNHIRAAFWDQVIVLNANARAGDNKIVFAFNDPFMVPDWDLIEKRAALLSKRCGMDFHQFASMLRLAHDLQRASLAPPPLASRLRSLGGRARTLRRP